MRRVLERQSELSLASAMFYLAGAVLALLSVTVFRLDGNPLTPANVITACAAGAVAVGFIWIGDRARRGPAIAVLCVAATLVLVSSVFTVEPLRLFNVGLLFPTFLIYLVWFGPMWLARTYGYAWLLLFWAVAIAKFGDEMAPLLVTMSVTSVLLGEFVGAFRQRLEASSLTDVLCGVWNQRGLQRILPNAIRAARRGSGRLSLLFLDLDDFKLVNDSLGHAEGDRVLRAFAIQVEHFSRPGDTLARVGGDEFVLLLPGTDAAQAAVVAERLQSNVEAAQWSYGIAELQPGEDTAELVRRADALMLEQKARRRAERTGGEPGGRR